MSDNIKTAAASPGAMEPVAWEYSFIHSSAIGHGDSEIGPLITSDKAVAFGVGCISQKPLYTLPPDAAAIIAAKDAEIGNWKRQFHAVRPAQDGLIERIGELEAEVERLRAELAATNALADRLSQQSSEYFMGERTGRKAARRHAGEGSEEVNTDAKKTEQTICGLWDLLDAERADNKRLRAQVAALTEQNTNLAEDVAFKTLVNDDLRRVHGAMAIEIGRLCGENLSSEPRTKWAVLAVGNRINALTDALGKARAELVHVKDVMLREVGMSIVDMNVIAAIDAAIGEKGEAR